MAFTYTATYYTGEFATGSSPLAACQALISLPTAPFYGGGVDGSLTVHSVTDSLCTIYTGAANWGAVVITAVGSPDLDWSSTSHVLQAVMVLVLVAIFFLGYSGGRRA